MIDEGSFVEVVRVLNSIEKIALVIADIIPTFTHPTLHHFLMHFHPLSHSIPLNFLEPF